MDYERIRQQLADAAATQTAGTTADAPDPGSAAAEPDPESTRRQRRRASHRRSRELSNRHVMRQLALLALFELDVTSHPFEEVVQRVIADPFLASGQAPGEAPVEAELDLPPDAVSDLARLEQSVRDLVYGVIRAIAAIDALIVEAAPAYPIDRIGTVDRNVLRLGIYELEYVHDEPIRDVVFESVELGKRFGGATTAAFVNGVLRTVAERIEGSGGAVGAAPAGTTARRRGRPAGRRG